jgi:hypothetical protein
LLTHGRKALKNELYVYTFLFLPSPSIMYHGGNIWKEMAGSAQTLDRPGYVGGNSERVDDIRAGNS